MVNIEAGNARHSHSIVKFANDNRDYFGLQLIGRDFCSGSLILNTIMKMSFSALCYPTYRDRGKTHLTIFGN